jgi:hypothetical protein
MGIARRRGVEEGLTQSQAKDAQLIDGLLVVQQR